jgi:hypothetical protein
MVKSAENRMRSNLELLPVMNVKSRPQYISALKIVVPDISRPKKSRHYFDALNAIDHQTAHRKFRLKSCRNSTNFYIGKIRSPVVHQKKRKEKKDHIKGLRLTRC